MASTATAAVVREPQGGFSLESVELDDLRRDEILIRVEASGVCHTDVHAQDKVPLPAVFGHEGTGVVEAVGAGANRVNVGDTVIISYGWCGQCPNCLDGSMHICDFDVPINFAGQRLDGSRTIKLDGTEISGAFFQQSSFATHAIAPERDVVVVDKELSAAMRAALPCGVLTGAGAVLNTFGVGARDSLLVAGSGAVGLSAVMAGKIAGAWPLIAVDILDSRLELAKELGASHVINAKDGDIAERVREIIPRGVKFALDTTANEHVLNSAINSLGMGGYCGMVTPPHMGEAYSFPMTDLFIRAGHLEGIFLGSSNPSTFIPKIIEYNRQGRFPYERLITEYDFKDINTAFDDVKSGKAIKPVLVMA
jgi:aryl-alcohol dehydrogenase